MTKTLTDFSKPVADICAELEDRDLCIQVRWFGKGIDQTEILFGFGDKAPSVHAFQMAIEIEHRFVSDAAFRQEMAVHSLAIGDALHGVERPAWEFRAISPEEVGTEIAAADQKEPA